MNIFKKVLKAKVRTDIETELRELIENECKSIALYGLNDAKLNILAMYIELHRLNSGLNSLESIIDSLKESGADLDSIISQLHDVNEE